MAVYATGHGWTGALGLGREAMVDGAISEGDLVGGGEGNEVAHLYGQKDMLNQGYAPQKKYGHRRMRLHDYRAIGQIKYTLASRYTEDRDAHLHNRREHPAGAVDTGVQNLRESNPHDA